MKQLTQVDLGSYRNLFHLFESAISVGEKDTLITASTDPLTVRRDMETRYQFDVALEELQRLQMWTVVQGKGASIFI